MERSEGVSSGSNSSIGERNASFSTYGVAAGDDATEISIFEAQKYFNDVIPDDQEKSSNNNNNHNAAVQLKTRAISSPLDNMEMQQARFSWASSSVHDEYSSINMARNNYRIRSFHVAATPTASSEASWNSQTGLLSHPAGTVAVSLCSPTHHHDHNKKTRGKVVALSPSPMVRWFRFPRRCPCSDKKSVRVEQQMSVKQPIKTATSHLTVAAARPAMPRSISLDLRNHTTKPKSMVVAASDDQHVMWDAERHCRWEDNMTAAGNSQNHLFRPVPVAFSFPILKPNGSLTSWSSLSSPMLKLQHQQQQPAAAKQEPILVRESVQPLTSTQVQASTTISIHKSAPNGSTDFSGLGFTSPASPKSRALMSNDEDLGSDASSDLFEIESFSTSTQTTMNANNYPAVLYHQYNNYRRDSMEDDALSFNASRGLYRRRSSLDIEPITPSSAEYCYEPSEASIDWSVTTAEGLDRPSTSSEVEYHQDELERMSSSRRRSSSAGNNGMLSCRWEKALSVGPNPVRLVNSMPVGSSSSNAAVVVCDEAMKHVGCRPPLPNKPRSSSHLSISFAASSHS